MIMKKKFAIEGMHCNSCARSIEEELKDKVENVKVSYSDGKAEIEFDDKKISEDEIKASIGKLGYGCDVENFEAQTGRNLNYLPWAIVIIGIGVLLFLLYFYVLRGLDVALPSVGEKSSLILLFVAGLLTGFHCIAMCGGFVVSYTAKNALEGHKSLKQHLFYGGGKLLSYTIIGGIFGLIGGVIAFSTGLRGWIAIAAGLYMIVYSLGMFGIAFFKRFQPSFRFLSKINGKVAGAYRAPLATGLLNGLFLACGPLQAMYIFAAGTGSVFTGASSLFAFGLGTLPVMFGFGSIATSISHKTTGRILKISAIIVLILGLVTINRGLALTGSSLSFDTLKAGIVPPTGENSSITLENGFQVINMDVDASGYHPNSFVLKQGIPVKWNINVKQLTSCNGEILVPSYKIDVKLKQGLQTIEFTPDKEGTIGFSCWMGMIRGSFIVTSTGEASQQQVQAATPKSSGGCGCGGGG